MLVSTAGKMQFIFKLFNKEKTVESDNKIPAEEAYQNQEEFLVDRKGEKRLPEAEPERVTRVVVVCHLRSFPDSVVDLAPVV